MKFALWPQSIIMIPMRFKNYFLAAGALLLLTSCEYVSPLIQDANIISVADEVQAGKQMQPEIEKTMQVVNDPSLTNAVRTIGNRLTAALPSKDFDYQFYVVADDSPNAFTIPGGTIYVHTGLMKFVSDEHELAGVLAHEIGHAYERHPAKSMTRQIGLAQLANRIGANSGIIKQMALKIAGTGALNYYSRSDESEADRIGFELLRRAGYRQDGLTRFLQKLTQLQNGRQTPVFLSSHPATPERVAALEALSKA